MAAALRFSYSVLKATTNDTSALKVNLVSGGLTAAAVSAGIQLGAIGSDTLCPRTIRFSQVDFEIRAILDAFSAGQGSSPVGELT
jgi:hypothetical protein